MTYTIKLTPEAKIDIQDSKEFYKLKSKKLAKEFLLNLDSAIEPLKTNPFLFQRGYRGIRKSPIAKFNSSIHYFTEEKTVVIIAVLHNSRNPQMWKGRTKQ
jgi:plasmid stabilization system protein ParE